MSTRLKLAVALGALTLLLLPAAAAQAATATPTALSFSSSGVGVPSAPQTVTYSVTAADSDVAHDPDVVRGGTGNDFAQTNNCFLLPAHGTGSCTVSVTFTPTIAGTLHSSLDFIPRTGVNQPPFASVSLTGVSPTVVKKGKKCHKKGKKASAAKKCKKHKK